MTNTGAIALVFGAQGGVGAALVAALREKAQYNAVLALGRRTTPAFDLLDEQSIEHAVAWVAGKGELRLVIDATGFLHDEQQGPEKSLRQLDATRLARAFALNAVGPALLMKHVLPKLPRSGRSVFGSLSARVGSIGDNRLGGWYGYRASKAALNQLVRTAAVELGRRCPEAVCVALHPGTVATALSAPFVGERATVFSPQEAAAYLLAVIDGLTAADSGGFFDWRGDAVPW